MRSGPAGLDRLKILRPRLAAVSRAVSGPRETIRLNIEVANSPDRRIAAREAEPLLDVHLRSFTVSGAEVLKAAARIGRTGRMGKEGTAITFVGEWDLDAWEAIRSQVKAPIEEGELRLYGTA